MGKQRAKPDGTPVDTAERKSAVKSQKGSGKKHGKRPSDKPGKPRKPAKAARSAKATEVPEPFVDVRELEAEVARQQQLATELAAAHAEVAAFRAAITRDLDAITAAARTGRERVGRILAEAERDGNNLRVLVATLRTEVAKVAATATTTSATTSAAAKAAIGTGPAPVHLVPVPTEPAGAAAPGHSAGRHPSSRHPSVSYPSSQFAPPVAPTPAAVASPVPAPTLVAAAPPALPLSDDEHLFGGLPDELTTAVAPPARKRRRSR